MRRWPVSYFGHSGGDVVDQEFKVGDLVRIREWDEMAEFYGTDAYGDIDVNEDVMFVGDMKCLCGTESTIESIDSYCDAPRYLFDNEKLNKWIITGEMLEHVQNQNDSYAEEIGSAEFLDIVLFAK